MMPMMRTNSWIPTVFNDLFDADYMPKANATAPAINVKESDKAYTVELAAPGMKKEDFNVHINDEGNLIIKMESKQEKKEEETKMEKILHVEGMMCEHCEANVKKALEAIDGVESALADHNANTAKVVLSKDVANEVLKQAVEAKDYKVTGIEG